ncbi:hypothetical protein [Paenibacillus sp. SI8]|uniref:DUF6917 domain-containing protein n=1 Tax=unclassified Paenibacillus TaxID=185978 RepID=UPI003466D1A5
MGKDPYAGGLLTFNPFAERRLLTGEIVTVLDGRLLNRGIELLHARSRVLKKYEIHELILTLEPGAEPGTQVNRVCYLGFFEVQQGAVIVAGDEVRIGEKWQGKVVGYDETHVPNHINIVVTGEEEKTGLELRLQVGDRIQFIPTGERNDKK